MKSSPACAFLPPSLLAAYGANRFHLAEPELSGLGVTTSIPGFSKSSQSLMFFGLPLRTTSETTDPNGMPLVASAFQSLATLLPLTRRLTSGSTEKLTMSAGLPSTTARDWSPEAPYDVVTATPLPSGVAAKAGMILLHPGSGTA